MRTLKFLLLLIVAAFLSVVFPAAAQTGNIADIIPVLDSLDGEPCHYGEFTCVTLTVPLDHNNPDGAVGTIDVVFAVLPASGERKGMFVNVVGGPGASGLALADPYAEAMHESVLENFDIVFFDQRGV
ncbi:MAG: hypothetical protein H7175_13685, partial [Burkholderiales bacterium]|nr:hypothetical protein [Anaerolineae bacterium]